MTRSLETGLQAHPYARPYTRAQKRNIRAQKALKRDQKGSQASQEQIQKLLELARQIDADHERTGALRDRGFHAPEQTGIKTPKGFIALRDTPCPRLPPAHTTGKLCAPAYPRKTVKRYITATTEKTGVDTVKLQALKPIPHFEPDPPPPRPPAHGPSTTKQMAEFEARLRQVIADAAAAKAEKESQTKVAYYVSLMV